jgi:hypothetical protein
MSTRLLLATFALLGTTAVAQTLSVSQHFKPGDSIHYFVRFDDNPEFDGLTLSFGMTTAAQKDQHGLAGGFSIATFKKTETGVFEVTGKIEQNLATGTYRLNQISAVHTPESRAYIYGQDFAESITINVVNEITYHFPAIKSITPESPK